MPPSMNRQTRPRELGRLARLLRPWRWRAGGTDARRPPTGGKASADIHARTSGRLDLATLRPGLGDRWELLAPSLHRVTGRFLAIKLDGRGSFTRAGDSYLIEMPGMSARQVAAECRTLLDELTELIYSGRSFDDHLKKMTAAAPRQGAGNTGRWQRLTAWVARSVSGLASRLRGARAQGPMATATEPPPAYDATAGDPAALAAATASTAPGPAYSPAPAIPRPAPEPVAGSQYAGAMPAAMAGQPPKPLERHPEMTPAAVAAAAAATNAGAVVGPPKLAAVPARRETELTLRLRERRQLETGIMTATLRRTGAADTIDDGLFPPASLHFRYVPVWNVRSKMLTTYVCVPACYRASGSLALGDELLPPRWTADDVLLLDMLNLEQAIQDLRERQAGGRGVASIVSVHLSTVAEAEQWKPYAAALETVPDDVRRRLLIEISGLGALRNQPRAFEVLRRITPMCRGIIVRTDLQASGLAFWKKCRVVAIGPHVGDDLRPEARIIADLNRFALLAEHAGLPTFVRGLHSRSLAIAAMAAGFHYIAGPVMGTRFNDAIGVVRRFELEDLYSADGESMAEAG